MLESLSSCNEDCNFKRSNKKTLSRLPSRSRTYIFPCSRGSSGPNCESDSEGVLTSRAIGKLSLCDGKRSVESDYGAPQYNVSKKSVRRRRKTKDSTPMQIDNCLFSTDAIRSYRRERRSLGKRKRWIEADKSSTKSMTSQGDAFDLDKCCPSDRESLDSLVTSDRLPEPCLTEEDTARDGDDEQSDWCQDFGAIPLYEIAFFDRTKTPRNSDDNSLSSYRNPLRSDLCGRGSGAGRQCNRRSIKTGNRRLLSRSADKGRARLFPPSKSASGRPSIADRHRRCSNKRLRCGSATFAALCESSSQMDALSPLAEAASIARLPTSTSIGKPPFKKGATERQIYGGHE